MVKLGRFRARGARVLLSLALASGTLISSTGIASAATCATDGNHWYARATSGFPAVGTRIDLRVPTVWSVDQSKNSTMDVAAWLYLQSDISRSIEGGFFSGYWPYGGGWFNGFYPYATLNNGANGYRGTTPVPTGNHINMDVTTGPGNIYTVKVGTWTKSSNYNFINVGVNMAQGEVVSSNKTWLLDGNGELLNGYWTDNRTNWYPWGSFTTCNNSPYFISPMDNNTFLVGGYGV